MAHTSDGPPVRFMVIARLIRVRNWAVRRPVEWGALVAAMWIAVLGGLGEPWWVAALCGVLFGVAAVLCLPRPTGSPSE